MICDQCYYKVGCRRKPTEDGRCSFYVKASKVKIKADKDVNPMDTAEFGAEDLRRLFEEIERRR